MGLKTALEVLQKVASDCNVAREPTEAQKDTLADAAAEVTPKIERRKRAGPAQSQMTREDGTSWCLARLAQR